MMPLSVIILFSIAVVMGFVNIATLTYASLYEPPFDWSPRIYKILDYSLFIGILFSILAILTSVFYKILY